MRADQLQVELYPRAPWEAMELGSALVRQYARAIWLPWLLLSLPVFVVLNALCIGLGEAWWAGVLLWWLKPVFDRIPLYVLSRAVFGAVPTVGETLRAQLRWGWPVMLACLTWRRLGPTRSLYLPVDLLEGGAHAGQRRRVIGAKVRGTAALLTWVCAHFEAMLLLASLALAMLFVPVELLTESAKAAWTLITQAPPAWLQVLLNAVSWLATSMIEPFYVGAGFGLYLDRRTRLEAWDVEIGFRRLRQRLATVPVQALALVLAAGMLGLGLPAVVQAAPVAESEDTLRTVFPQAVHDPGFADAVKRAEQDPLLHPTRKRTEWVPIKPNEKDKEAASDSKLLQAIAAAVAFIGKYGLWLVVALLLGLLVKSRARWLPWLQAMAAAPRAVPSLATHEAHVDDEPLPEDVVASIRALWQQGRRRPAMALLYRAGVAAMVARTGAVLVPGATEADCLRAARNLQDMEAREGFVHMVRVWQYAAYAQQWPETEALDALLQRLAGSFGWRA